MAAERQAAERVLRQAGYTVRRDRRTIVAKDGRHVLCTPPQLVALARDLAAGQPPDITTWLPYTTRLFDVGTVVRNRALALYGVIWRIRPEDGDTPGSIWVNHPMGATTIGTPSSFDFLPTPRPYRVLEIAPAVLQDAMAASGARWQYAPGLASDFGLAVWKPARRAGDAPGLAAYASVSVDTKDTGNITGIEVLDEGKGLGRALVTALMWRYRRLEARVVEADAQGFWEALGFEAGIDPEDGEEVWLWTRS